MHSSFAGLIVYGFFAQIETTVPAAAVISDQTACIYVGADQKTNTDMTAKISGCEYEIIDMSDNPLQLNKENDAYLLYVLGEDDGFFYKCDLPPVNLKDGVYKAELVTEKLRPISYLLR